MNRTALSVTRRPRALWAVPSQPPGAEWVYQLGSAFQLSPTEIGVVANIRRCHVRTVDLEVGNDLVIMDRLADIEPKRIVPLNRSAIETHPRAGERILMGRYPLAGGFVPLGALRTDGTLHPHAGTGFALSVVLGFPVDAAGNPTVYGEWDIKDRYYAFELQQYRYDGALFVVEDVQLRDGGEFVPGWQVTNLQLGNCLADGDDLSGGLTARRTGGSETDRSGLVRWQRQAGRWQPAAFTPVTVADGSFEPSLVRDPAGALLFSVRGRGPIDRNDIQVWRSADAGLDWELALHASKVVAGTPVTINKALDGTVYIAGNPDRETDSLGRRQPSIEMRETLLLWPLAANSYRLLDPVLARDCKADFGEPPFGSIWRADHPVGLNVRLADGQWHHLLAYRVLEQNECISDAPATAFTGTYLEEVQTAGPPVPEWRFS